jgi:hypothetical protein
MFKKVQPNDHYQSTRCLWGRQSNTKIPYKGPTKQERRVCKFHVILFWLMLPRDHLVSRFLYKHCYIYTRTPSVNHCISNSLRSGFLYQKKMAIVKSDVKATRPQIVKWKEWYKISIVILYDIIDQVLVPQVTTNIKTKSVYSFPSMFDTIPESLRSGSNVPVLSCNIMWN